eukprot:TRINITY_DN687784_c0_g2_i4.p1 TRINITY_DN687784_c0_g2~~TRINITY_DN687784_c0_g2_i4.p1  ORF type:complete len:187 (+),score=33.36 TRINITY_DN687784_c0_g2_i4:19-579(+)
MIIVVNKYSFHFFHKKDLVLVVGFFTGPNHNMLHIHPKPFKSLFDAQAFCKYLSIDCNDEVRSRLGEFAFEFGDSDSFILREAADILKENPKMELKEVNEIIVGRIKEELQTWLNDDSEKPYLWRYHNKQNMLRKISNESECDIFCLDVFIADFKRPIFCKCNDYRLAVFPSRVNAMAIKQFIDDL